MAHDQKTQLWNDTLGQLINLANVTKARNNELEMRVQQLERELVACQNFHNAVPLSGGSALKTPAKDLIICVIDGDANVFNQTFIRRGEQGGYEAGQTLGKGIAEYLEHLAKLGRVDIPSRPSFWTTVFLDKSGLHDTLVSRNVCSSVAFDDFFRGFSQASPRFVIADVGRNGDTADKIAGYLQTYLAFPQTLRFFFAGTDAATYQSALSTLGQRQLLEPLVLLDGVRGTPSTLSNLRLPALKLDGLFMERDPSPLTPAASPVLQITPPRGMFASGLASPQSPCISSVPYASSGPRLVDPTKPLHRQSPPPCNEYYLMSCSKGFECKYSHDYLLTPDELGMLAASAKKAPCSFLKKGVACENGPSCCWGHECPHGRLCFHYSKKKCWFKGEGMHDGATVDGA